VPGAGVTLHYVMLIHHVEVALAEASPSLRAATPQAR
jgi:hypothetical protein